MTVVLCLVGSPANCSDNTCVAWCSRRITGTHLFSQLGWGAATCVDFSECAQSATIFISACLSSCQNLFGHMCVCFLILCLCVWGRERGEFLTVHLHCVVWLCTYTYKYVCMLPLLVGWQAVVRPSDSFIKSCCSGNPQWQDAIPSVGFLHQGLSGA